MHAPLVLVKAHLLYMLCCGAETLQVFVDLQVVISLLPSQAIGYASSPERRLNFKSFLFVPTLLDLLEALQKPADSSGLRNLSAFHPGWTKVWTKLDKTL